MRHRFIALTIGLLFLIVLGAFGQPTESKK